MWSLRYRPYVVSVLNIAMNILLVHLYGLEGVVFVTLFTSVCISYPWILYILFKGYFKDKPWAYLKHLASQSGIVLIAGALTYLLCQYVVPGYSIAKFTIRILICAVVPNVIFMLTIGRSSDVREIVLKLTKGRI